MTLSPSLLLAIVVAGGVALAVLLHWAARPGGESGPIEQFGPVREGRGRITIFLWVAYAIILLWAIGFTAWAAIFGFGP